MLTRLRQEGAGLVTRARVHASGSVVFLKNCTVSLQAVPVIDYWYTKSRGRTPIIKNVICVYSYSTTKIHMNHFEVPLGSASRPRESRRTTRLCLMILSSLIIQEVLRTRVPKAAFVDNLVGVHPACNRCSGFTYMFIKSVYDDYPAL